MPGATAPTIATTSYASLDTFDISTVEPVAIGEPDITFLRMSKAYPDFGGYYIKNGRLTVASRSGVIPSGLNLPTTLKNQSLPRDVFSVEWSFDELARWRVPFVENSPGFSVADDRYRRSEKSAGRNGVRYRRRAEIVNCRRYPVECLYS
jgi:hypothetical protein